MRGNLLESLWVTFPADISVGAASAAHVRLKANPDNQYPVSLLRGSSFRRGEFGIVPDIMGNLT